MSIKTISFRTIKKIWVELLWPNRSSVIDKNSAMNFMGGYSAYNMTTNATFFGYYHRRKLVGVNSGHMCENGQYRSRGLYVFEEHRGHGIGLELLQATIDQATVEGAHMIWSLPRYTSWRTYQKAGFSLCSDWFETETSDQNAYCTKQINNKIVATIL